MTAESKPGTILATAGRMVRAFQSFIALALIGPTIGSEPRRPEASGQPAVPSPLFAVHRAPAFPASSVAVRIDSATASGSSPDQSVAIAETSKWTVRNRVPLGFR